MNYVFFSKLQERREKLTLMDEVKEDLRRTQKSMNQERELREMIEKLCVKYSSQPVKDAADIMLDVEQDHQRYLFTLAHQMNKRLTEHISRESYLFRVS